MKKVSGTRRLLAVVLTIAMLLQNSAGVLATDGANAVSNLPQEQSTEQPDVNAASEQTDAGAQDGENTDVSKKNEAPETQAPQTDAPQTDEPETAAPETQATATEAPQTAASETQASETETPQTSAPETNAPQTDAPETDVPKAQETPGLTQPGGDKTGTDEAGADKESSLIQGNENSESAETQKEFAIGNNASEKDEEEAANILLEDGIMPIAGPEYITKISFDINAADATWEAPESIGVKKDDEASIDYLELENSGNSYKAKVPENKYVKNEAILFKPKKDPVQKGKIFEFWYKDGSDQDYFGGKDSTTIKNTSTTLYAKWSDPICKITYTLNGGDTDSIESFPTTYTVGGTEIDFSKYIPTRTFKNEKKEGQDKTYNFLGWFSDPDYKNKVTSTKGLSGDITLYAKWEAVGRVRYWLNDTTNTGIEWGAASSLSEEAWNAVNKKTRGEPGTTDYSGPYYIDDKFYSQAEGNDVVGETTVTIPTEVPVRAGYSFSQWKQSNKYFNPGGTDTYNSNGRWECGEAGTSFADDTVPNYQTYTAQWDECQVTITYKATEGGTVRVNNGTDTAKTETTETVGADTGVVLGAVAEARQGYHFTGWKVENNENILAEDATLTRVLVDSVTDKPEKEGYTPVYHEATFVASFAPDTYTVKYDKNSDDATGNMEDQTYTFGIARNLDGNSFLRQHFEFVGWALNSGATEATYADKESFAINADNIASLNVEEDNTVTLYAVWKELSPATITYVLNGRNEKEGFKTFNSPGNKESYWPGEDSFDFEEPTYEVISTDGSTEKKYGFDGWYTDPTFKEGTKKSGITLDDRGNITVYARWEAVGILRYYLYWSGEDFSAFADDVEWDYPKDILDIEGSNDQGQYIAKIRNYTDGSNGALTGTKTFVLPDKDPVRKGYDFEGWRHNGEFNDGNSVNEKNRDYYYPFDGDYDPVTRDPDGLTLRAQWTPYTYSVIFDENLDGKADGSDETRTQQFTYDEEAKLNENGAEGSGTTIAGYTREGYTFAGWAKTPDATEAVYHDGDKVLNWKIAGAAEIAWNPETGKEDRAADGETLILYAVWTPNFAGLEVKGFTQKYDGKTYSATLKGAMAGDVVTYFDGPNGTKLGSHTVTAAEAVQR